MKGNQNRKRDKPVNHYDTNRGGGGDKDDGGSCVQYALTCEWVHEWVCGSTLMTAGGLGHFPRQQARSLDIRLVILA